MIGCTRWADIDPSIQAKLNRFIIEKRPIRWNGQAMAVKVFKQEIMKQGLIIQGGRCAWCTLEVGEAGRRTAHRDHIAPKGQYPAWTFVPENLVITCEYCNGFLVKGDTDTIAIRSDNYHDCEFHLVHPYLDDPSLHISFRQHREVPGVLIKSHSPKGTWTIKLFGLATPMATANRVKDKLYEQHKSRLDEHNQARFKQALEAIDR